MSDASQKIPYPLRMPDSLRSQLEEARSGRSLNAEIVKRLEESFNVQTPESHLALLRRIERQLTQSENAYSQLLERAASLANASKLVAAKFPKTVIKQDAELKSLLKQVKEVTDLLDSNLKLNL